MWTKKVLATQLNGLGIERGDMVMVHAAMRQVGPLISGPDTLIDALRETVGPTGTLIAYTDWEIGDSGILDNDGNVPESHRTEIRPFDPQGSRSTRDNGILAEFIRTTPGALRSGNPDASVAALGARAGWITADHPLDYGYGENSPLAKLTEAKGKVLNIGAPRDTMTLLHHAEHLACIPGKRIRRYDVPFAKGDGVAWRAVEEFDTSNPVAAGLSDDYFAEIVSAFLEAGHGQVGKIGIADSLLVPAAEIVAYAVNWLESRFSA